MKYYFIAYGAKHTSDGEHEVWNDVIAVSPMEFIKDVEKTAQESGNENYRDYVVLCVLEITKEEFEKFDGHF